MSQFALLKAVRDTLRAPAPEGGLGYTAHQCRAMYDGQPPPDAPQEFIAVHPGDWRTVDIEGLDELYGVDVTVTLRTAGVPLSRQGEITLLDGPEEKTLDYHLARIKVKLHRNYNVLAQANATIGSQDSGFVVALRFAGQGTKPIPQTAAWFHAAEDQRFIYVGVSQTLRFVEAERVQVIEEQG